MTIEHQAVQVDEHGQPRWTNRRGYVRYQCPLATMGRVYPDGKQEFHRGWVMNLSKGGAGLLLSRPLPVGQEVALQITIPDSGQKYEIPARVIHFAEQLSGDWFIGFAFAQPLADDLIDQLL